MSKTAASFLAILFLSIALCFLVFYDAQRISYINVNDSEYQNINVDWKIEDIKFDKNILSIIIEIKEKNEENQIFKTFVALYDEETSQYLRLPTMLNSKYSVVSSTLLNKLDLDNKKYEICIDYENDNNKSIIHTKKYIGAENNDL